MFLKIYKFEVENQFEKKLRLWGHHGGEYYRRFDENG